MKWQESRSWVALDRSCIYVSSLAFQFLKYPQQINLSTLSLSDFLAVSKQKYDASVCLYFPDCARVWPGLPNAEHWVGTTLLHCDGDCIWKLCNHCNFLLGRICMCCSREPWVTFLLTWNKYRKIPWLNLWPCVPIQKPWHSAPSQAYWAWAYFGEQIKGREPASCKMITSRALVET